MSPEPNTKALDASRGDASMGILPNGLLCRLKQAIHCSHHQRQQLQDCMMLSRPE